MSRGFNMVVFEGNLARDPEIKSTANGKKYTLVSLAVSGDYKDKSGQWVKHCDFIPCVAWGAQAEIIAKYCAKGKPLLVRGKLRQSTYEKNGEKKNSLQVLIEELVLQSAQKKNDAAEGTGEPMCMEEDTDAPDVEVPF